MIDYAIPVTGEMTDDAITQSSLYGMIAFRGHEAASEFLMVMEESTDPENSITYEFEPRHTATSTVSVEGGAEAISDVVIILDCSFSMDDEIRDGEDGEIRPKMDIARDIVRGLLETLRRQLMSMSSYGRQCEKVYFVLSVQEHNEANVLSYGLLLSSQSSMQSQSFFIANPSPIHLSNNHIH